MLDRGADGGQGGVQVGGHHRHPGQVVRVAQQLVVGGVLLVHAGHDRLQRGVAGLDQVAPLPAAWASRHLAGILSAAMIGGRRFRQAVGDGHDQGVPARAQTQGLRVRVQQHPVADLGFAHQRGVGQGPAVLVPQRTVSSSAPGQLRPRCVTVPSSQPITRLR